MKSKSKKIGVILSYLIVICNMVSNLLLVPFYLQTLGADAYGFYQYVYSLAQYAMILDFGIAAIVTKYLTIFRMNGTQKDEENFLGHVRIIVAISIAIIFIVGTACYINIDKLIIKRTQSEIDLAKQMLFLMISRIVIAIIQHYYDGILLAYERYVTTKGINVIRIISKIILIVICVIRIQNVLGIVIGDISASIFCLIWSVGVTKGKTHYKAKLHFFDKVLFREAMLLASAIMIQSIVSYANNALDKYIVGSVLNNSAVTIYAMALLIYEVFQDMSITVNSVFLPQVSKAITLGGTNEDITSIVIKIGRLQCVLCMAMFFGFALFGEQFLQIWAHSDVEGAWTISMILMTGGIVPLCETTCLSVLTVKNKRMFRSLILLAVAICNTILSIILIQLIGIIGVAIGTMIAILVGNALVMNIYYKREIGLNVGRIFREIFPRIGAMAVITSALVLPLRIYMTQNNVTFFLEIIIFCIVYAILLYLFALNKQEKEMIQNVKRRMLRMT